MLEENWDAVQVFQLCQQTWAAGIAGAHALGFTALEIDASCRLKQIPPDCLSEVAQQVMDMGRIAAEELNRRKQ